MFSSHAQNTPPSISLLREETNVSPLWCTQLPRKKMLCLREDGVFFETYIPWWRRNIKNTCLPFVSSKCQGWWCRVLRHRAMPEKKMTVSHHGRRPQGVHGGLVYMSSEGPEDVLYEYLLHPVQCCHPQQQILGNLLA